jgi:hypothetical protein
VVQRDGLNRADRVATQEMLDAWFVYNWEYDAWRLSGEACDYLIDQLHNCLAIKPGDDL